MLLCHKVLPLAKGKIERNPAFSAMTIEDTEYFENILRTNVIKEEKHCTYNMDWTGTTRVLASLF